MYVHALVKSLSVFLLSLSLPSLYLSFLVIAFIVATDGDSSEIPGWEYMFCEEINLPQLGASWSKFFSFLWCHVNKCWLPWAFAGQHLNCAWYVMAKTCPASWNLELMMGICWRTSSTPKHRELCKSQLALRFIQRFCTLIHRVFEFLFCLWVPCFLSSNWWYRFLSILDLKMHSREVIREAS